MKHLLLLCLLITIAAAQFCPVCVQQGRKSCVYQGGSTCTLMGWTPYYDEDGVWHNENPNVTTTHWSCSNGHTWITRDGRGHVGEPDCIDSMVQIPAADSIMDSAELVSNDTMVITADTLSLHYHIDTFVVPTTRYRMGKNFWTRLKWLFTGEME